MNAVYVTRYGGPEVLAFREGPDPELRDNEVLVQVRATNVNFADIQVRSGRYPHDSSPPFIPGLEAGGVIVGLGVGVTEFELGQRVTAFAARGSYGELMVSSAQLTYPIPDDLPFDVVAGLTAAITAENVLGRSGELVTGETVLVHAAAGGVGLLALQLARLYGAGFVIGTVGSDEKVPAALDAGAHAVINYRSEDFAAKVLELTDRAGADLILDAVTGQDFERNFECLAAFGRIVVFGQASGAPGIVSTDRLFKENRSVRGYSSGHIRRHRPGQLKPVAAKVIDYLQTGSLQMIIGARFPLSEAASAHAFVESRQSVGKVLLEP
jgi:NADPH2:quinone reductase